MIVSFHKEIIKDFRKQPNSVQKKFEDRLVLFMRDEYDPVLNNHTLKGKYDDYRSINVTGNIRAIFKRTKNEALFITINPHSNLYH